MTDEELDALIRLFSGARDSRYYFFHESAFLHTLEEARIACENAAGLLQRPDLLDDSAKTIIVWLGMGVSTSMSNHREAASNFGQKTLKQLIKNGAFADNDFRMLLAIRRLGYVGYADVGYNRNQNKALVIAAFFKQLIADNQLSNTEYSMADGGEIIEISALGAARLGIEVIIEGIAGSHESQGYNDAVKGRFNALAEGLKELGIDNRAQTLLAYTHQYVAAKCGLEKLLPDPA